MENNSLRNTGHSRKRTDLPGIFKNLSQLAEQTGYAEAVQSLIQESMSITDKVVHLSIVGTIVPSFINRLLETEFLPASSISVNAFLEIAATDQGEASYFIKDNQRYPIVGLIDRIDETNKPLHIFLDNAWLRQNHIVVLTIPNPSIDTEKEDEIIRFFSGTDLILFMTNALGALTKNEVALFAQCEEKNISAIVGISRLDMVESGEQKQLIDYVKNYLEAHFKIPSLLPDYLFLPACSASEWQNVINDKVAVLDLSQQRLDFFFTKTVHLLLNMRNYVIARVQENTLSIKEIRQNEKEMVSEINKQKNQWEEIKIKLQEKCAGIENFLKTYLSKHREQIADKLYHELEVTNDVKISWEKNIPSIVKREMQSVIDRTNAQVQKNINETVLWLNTEASIIFQYKIEFTNMKSHEVDHLTDHRPASIKLMDGKQARINSNFGKAGAVLGFGALIVSIPIGGIMLAGSLLYQALSEQFFSNKTKAERKKVKPELTRFIEKMELNFLNEFSHKLKEYFDDIIKDLKKSQSDWFAGKINEVNKKSTDDLEQINEKQWQETAVKINALLAGLI